MRVGKGYTVEILTKLSKGAGEMNNEEPLQSRAI